jgi:hypothetical protein
MVLFILGMGSARPGRPQWRATPVWTYAAFLALFFVLVGELNRRAARKLDRRIQELDKESQS